MTSTRESADELMASAEQQASRILDTASRKAEATVATARRDAVAEADRIRSEFRLELDQLEADREEIETAIEVRNDIVAEQRASMGAMIDALKILIEQDVTIDLSHASAEPAGSPALA